MCSWILVAASSWVIVSFIPALWTCPVLHPVKARAIEVVIAAGFHRFITLVVLVFSSDDFAHVL